MLLSSIPRRPYSSSSKAIFPTSVAAPRLFSTHRHNINLTRGFSSCLPSQKHVQGLPTDNTNKTQLFKLCWCFMPQMKYSSFHTKWLQTTTSQCSKILCFVRDSILFPTTLQYGFSAPPRPPVFHTNTVYSQFQACTHATPFLKIPSSLFPSPNASLSLDLGGEAFPLPGSTPLFHPTRLLWSTLLYTTT